MINKAFWKKVADNWTTDADGIEIPDVIDGGSKTEGWIEDDESIDDFDEDLSDLLSDLDDL